MHRSAEEMIWTVTELWCEERFGGGTVGRRAVLEMLRDTSSGCVKEKLGSEACGTGSALRVSARELRCLEKRGVGEVTCRISGGSVQKGIVVFWNRTVR